MAKSKLTLSEAVRLVTSDSRFTRAILRDPTIIRTIIDVDAEPLIESERLGMSDALRIASTNEGFAQELMKNPEAFRGTFNFSDLEIKAIRTIPDAADLKTQFSYDA